MPWIEFGDARGYSKFYNEPNDPDRRAAFEVSDAYLESLLVAYKSANPYYDQTDAVILDQLAAAGASTVAAAGALGDAVRLDTEFPNRREAWQAEQLLLLRLAEAAQGIPFDATDANYAGMFPAEPPANYIPNYELNGDLLRSDGVWVHVSLADILAGKGSTPLPGRTPEELRAAFTAAGGTEVARTVLQPAVVDITLMRDVTGPSGAPASVGSTFGPAPAVAPGAVSFAGFGGNAAAGGTGGSSLIPLLIIAAGAWYLFKGK